MYFAAYIIWNMCFADTPTKIHGCGHVKPVNFRYGRGALTVHGIAVQQLIGQLHIQAGGNGCQHTNFVIAPMNKFLPAAKEFLPLCLGSDVLRHPAAKSLQLFRVALANTLVKHLLPLVGIMICFCFLAFHHRLRHITANGQILSVLHQIKVDGRVKNFSVYAVVEISSLVKNSSRLTFGATSRILLAAFFAWKESHTPPYRTARWSH